MSMDPNHTMDRVRSFAADVLADAALSLESTDAEKWFLGCGQLAERSEEPDATFWAAMGLLIHAAVVEGGSRADLEAPRRATAVVEALEVSPHRVIIAGVLGDIGGSIGDLRIGAAVTEAVRWLDTGERAVSESARAAFLKAGGWLDNPGVVPTLGEVDFDIAELIESPPDDEVS